ncbi:MAG: serine hydrolase [Candidatus Moranbacteria bacterium]|nr:serine hydrolase [Candidatus Moranbacteria bacterium]
MSSIITLVTIIIFPLNFFWITTPWISDGQNKKNILENYAKEIQGAEKSQEGLFPKKNPLPPAVLPTKKEAATDLAIPNAHSSLILDVESGTILHYQNGREHRPIASLVKLMTAVIVMERISNLNEEVTVDEEAVYAEGTKIGCPRSGYCISQRLKAGEKITVSGLLKAMLMNSANDAAIALGKHISGSQEEFAKLMNEKARELGLGDSRFCTPSGLEIDGRESECHSSAYDVARIAAYSMKYDLIWHIFRLPTNTIVTSADGKYSHTILNTDLVLDQVPNCLGGKTGFTPLAGHSLLLASTDPSKKHKIVAVVLDDPYRWQDIKTMVDWAWRSYEWR